MFRPLFKPKKPELDPALGDRLAKVILSEAKQENLTTLLKEVVSLRAGEWDRRAFYIDLAAEHMTRPDSLKKLPDTPFGNLVKGRMATRFAWKVRGGGTGDTVSEDTWESFYEYLSISGRHLLRAAEQDEQDPTPFAFLQPVAMGLQMERKIAETWFREAIQRDPTNREAHYGHLFLVCEKWGGSHKDMYAFARATMKRIPTSSTLYSIILVAFQEHYLYLKAFDENIEGAKAFLRDKRVRAESIKVYQNSLQKQKRIERVTDYWPHNVAAWWFMTLNMPDVVRQETKKIGPHFTRFPWAMFYNDPAVGYQQALDI
jgi:hypothetical protein